MKSVIVLIGSGQIGQAIARRVGVGKHVLLADLRPENAKAAAEVKVATVASCLCLLRCSAPALPRRLSHAATNRLSYVPNLRLVRSGRVGNGPT